MRATSIRSHIATKKTRHNSHRSSRVERIIHLLILLRHLERFLILRRPQLIEIPLRRRLELVHHRRPVEIETPLRTYREGDGAGVCSGDVGKRLGAFHTTVEMRRWVVRGRHLEGLDVLVRVAVDVDDGRFRGHVGSGLSSLR